MFTIARFAHDLDIVFAFEDHLEVCSDQCLIVDQQDPDAHAASLFSGKDACTVKPPPGRGPARTCPPWSAAAFPHPDQPQAGVAPPSFRIPFRSVVQYFHLKFG